MVLPHTGFPEVSWVMFSEVDSVVVHATSITSVFCVFPVFAEVTVAVAQVAPKFQVFLSLDGMLAA